MLALKAQAHPATNAVALPLEASGE